MSITHTTCEDGMRVDITISGRFDFKLSRAFRDTYQQQPDDISIDYHINLAATDYMDSSALGMLLLIREHARNNGGSVILDQPSPPSASALRAAKFESLFRINGSLAA